MQMDKAAAAFIGILPRMLRSVIPAWMKVGNGGKCASGRCAPDEVAAVLTASCVCHMDVKVARAEGRRLAPRVERLPGAVGESALTSTMTPTGGAICLPQAPVMSADDGADAHDVVALHTSEG